MRLCRTEKERTWCYGYGTVACSVSVWLSQPRADEPAFHVQVCSRSTTRKAHDRRPGDDEAPPGGGRRTTLAARSTTHPGRGARRHLFEQADAADQACQTAGDRRERTVGPLRLAADRCDGGNRRLWRRHESSLFEFGGSLDQHADRPGD